MYNLVYKTPTCTLHGYVQAPDTIKHDDLIRITAEAWGVKEYDLCDWTITRLSGQEAPVAFVH